MKLNILMALLAMTIGSVSAYAGDFDEDACFENYEKSSKNKNIRATMTLLEDASDDSDYESIDAAVEYVRTKKNLAKWNSSAEEDPMNFHVTIVIENSGSFFCEGRPKKIQQVYDYLANKGLPEFYKNNPEEAKAALWAE